MDVKTVYVNIVSEEPTKDRGKFEHGVTFKVDDSAPLDVGAIVRMDQHTFRPTQMSLKKGKHTITFTNASTYHVKLDVVIDGLNV